MLWFAEINISNGIPTLVLPFGRWPERRHYPLGIVDHLLRAGASFGYLTQVTNGLAVQSPVAKGTVSEFLVTRK